MPSLNSTETFGLVQIEAMINGTPSIASNFPGVRQPPTMTGMGVVVPIGDADALADAFMRVFDHPENYCGDPHAIARQFSPQVNAAAYEELYQELMDELKSAIPTQKISSRCKSPLCPILGVCCERWNRVFMKRSNSPHRHSIWVVAMGILPDDF